MNKQVNLTTRPPKNRAADNWVETRSESPPPRQVKPKRLTIDIDPELHKRLKLHCFQQDVPIADLLRELIAQTLDAEGS